MIAPLAHYLRMWDVASANRVDEFVANSRNVQNRIWKAYRRPSEIVYPPVSVDDFYNAEPDDYYLVVSELVAYKRLDDAVRCFTRTGRHLKIVGGGPEYSAAEKHGRPNGGVLWESPRFGNCATCTRAAGQSFSPGKKTSELCRSKRLQVEKPLSRWEEAACWIAFHSPTHVPGSSIPSPAKPSRKRFGRV